MSKRILMAAGMAVTFGLIGTAAQAQSTDVIIFAEAEDLCLVGPRPGIDVAAYGLTQVPSADDVSIDLSLPVDPDTGQTTAFSVVAPLNIMCNGPANIDAEPTEDGLRLAAGGLPPGGTSGTFTVALGYTATLVTPVAAGTAFTVGEATQDGTTVSGGLVDLTGFVGMNLPVNAEGENGNSTAVGAPRLHLAFPASTWPVVSGSYSEIVVVTVTPL